MHNENDRIESKIDENNKEMEKLQISYNNNCIVLKNTETANVNLQSIISDKNEIIKNQKLLIAGIQRNSDNTIECAVLEKLEALVSVRNNEIKELEQKVRDVTTDRVCNCEEIRKLLDVEKKENESLTRIIEDKDLIISKMGLAYDGQNELVKTKEDLIQNMKMLLETNEKMNSATHEVNRTSVCSPENNLTSQNHGAENNGDVSRCCVCSDTEIPGLNETTVRLKGIGLHGVILDGLLTWIDTQRRTTPVNV